MTDDTAIPQRRSTDAECAERHRLFFVEVQSPRIRLQTIGILGAVAAAALAATMYLTSAAITAHALADRGEYVSRGDFRDAVGEIKVSVREINTSIKEIEKRLK